MAENSDLGTLYYDVEADLSDAVNSTSELDKSIKKTEASLKKGESAIKRTGTAATGAAVKMKPLSASIQGLGRATQGTAALMMRFIPILAGLAAVQSAGQIIQLANAWQELQNKLRLVTSSQDELNTAMDSIYKIAQKTNQAIDPVATTYQRFAQNAEALGLSQKDIAEVTETVAKAIAISGASAAAAEASLTQFGQALASGVLRGDEFNSVMEQTPGLAMAIAEGMGVPLGALRALAADGKITADILVQALKRAGDSVEQQFNTRVVTAGQAWQNMQNSVQRAVGEFDQATGVSTTLAQGILRMSEALDSVDFAGFARELDAVQATVDSVVEVATGAIQSVADVVSEMGTLIQRDLTEVFGDFFDFLPDASDTAASAVGRSFEDMYLSSAKEIDKISEVFTGTVGGIQGIFSALSTNIPILFSKAWSKVLSGAASFVNSLSDLVSGPLEKLGIGGLGHVSWGGGGGGTAEIVSIGDAWSTAYAKASKGAGAYDAAVRKIGDAAIWRAQKEDIDAAANAADKASKKLKPLELGAGTGKGKGKKGGGKGKAAGKSEEAKAAESDAAAIAKLRQEVALAALAGQDLAEAKAANQLSKFATPEQVETAKALGAELERLNKLQAERKKFGDDPEKHIVGDVQPLTGGMFDEQFERYQAEAEAEQKRYEESQKRLETALQLRLITQEKYAELESQIKETHAKRDEQIQRAQLDMLFQQGEASFGALADVLKDSQGEQSSAYKAMFAVSKGFAIAQAALSMGVAMGRAWELPWPANLAALGVAVTNMAAIASNIRSVGATFGGGKMYGGGVDSGKMYRVNEGGAPELLNMSNGQQYMIPNGRGEVVSNKDAQGNPKGMNVSINLQEDAQRAGTYEQSGTDDDRIINVFVANIRSGGRADQAMRQTYDVARKGR